ncbi:SRPBCC family protein [Pedobacter sp. 22226]|uniref:SRPBCC family protein n=1 Tax=Pedobacter sp. 22226 TaxID=3453894 RepID=UPI003F8614D9
MENEPVIVERIYNVPIEKVWNALTDNNEIKQWYFQLADFKPEVGFKFQFSGGADNGPQYLHLCEVTEVIPGKKIAYTWRYDGLPGNSEVSWELFEQGDKTLLKLKHTGLESFATSGPDFAKSSFNGGWNYFLNEAL